MLNLQHLAFGLAIGQHQRLFELLAHQGEIAAPDGYAVMPLGNGGAQPRAFHFGKAAHRRAQGLRNLRTVVIDQAAAALLQAHQRGLDLGLSGLQLVIAATRRSVLRELSKLVPGGVFAHPGEVAERSRYARHDAADMTVGRQPGQRIE